MGQALALVAASAFALALYARVEWPWLIFGWVGLVPWLAALDRSRSLRSALACGLLMSAAFCVAVFGWLVTAVQSYTGVSTATAVLLLLVLSPFLQPQFPAFAMVRTLGRRRGAARWQAALLGAFAYTGAEWVCPKLFADTIGHGLYASRLMRQAADLAGAGGLTFVLVLANEGALAALRAVRRPARFGERMRAAAAPSACIAALVLGLDAYGIVRIAQLRPDPAGSAALTAGIVQADISHYDRLAAEIGTYEAVRRILDSHFELSGDIAHQSALDLLIWPETVYPTTFGSPKSEDGAAFDREIDAFVERTRVPLLFGAYDADGGAEFNAAFLLEPSADGSPGVAAYRKARPFPLTEVVPTLLDGERIRRWLPWLGTWKAGRGPRVLSLQLPRGGRVSIAPLICYDAIDPSLAIAAVRQGAELLVTLSNDSWFAAGDGPRLHLVVSAFRSLETRRPQLRATNTGISAIITPTGEMLGTLGVDRRGTLLARVTPVRHASTLMLAWGDWFGPASLAAAVLLLLLPGRRRTIV